MNRKKILIVSAIILFAVGIFLILPKESIEVTELSARHLPAIVVP